MTNTDLAYFVFCAVVIPIILISVRNLYKNMMEGKTLIGLLWLSLLAWAILYFGFVSQQTDADTIAFWWIEHKLRELWQLVENLPAIISASQL